MNTPVRVLVIEDHPANLELMSYLLRASGYDVSTATDGVEGLATAKRDVPNLVLCDIQMPVKDGYAVARELRSDALLDGTILAAVTALAMTGDRERALTSGFDAYITKPIEPELFIGQIRDVLSAGRRTGARS